MPTGRTARLDAGHTMCATDLVDRLYVQVTER
jgi:hypothetical protein